MIERTIYKQILISIKNRPITLICGARQVGKSTLCRKIKNELNFNYVSLDDLRERDSAIKDPELFLKLHKPPLIIDEIQYAPKLFDVIEHIVNEEKFLKGNNYGMFVLTGSQTFKLLEKATESMAGRVGIINMFPLSTSEIYNVEETPFDFDLTKKEERIRKYKISIFNLYELIVKGMYPELYDNISLDKDYFYSSYIETYINKDVSQIINLKDKLKFINFMEILASLTGEELVIDNLSKAIGVTNKTIESRLSVLYSSNIIYLLKPYNENSIFKRAVKRSKIYFLDTGLASYLARLNDPNILRNSIFNGRFVETYIFNEIYKSYKNNNRSANFYYYRDKEQNEIDLLILNKGELSLVECKSGVSYSLKDVSSFKKIEKLTKFKIGNKCIICNTDKIYTIGENIMVYPISAI